MLINAKTARKLIASGKAGNPSFVWEDGVDHQLTQPRYVSFDNYEFQRTDYFEVEEIAVAEWKNA